MRTVELRTGALVAGLVLALAASAPAERHDPPPGDRPPHDPLWSWTDAVTGHLGNGRAGWLMAVAAAAVGLSTLALAALARGDASAREDAGACADGTATAPAARYPWIAGRPGRWLLAVAAAGMLTAALAPAGGLAHRTGAAVALIALPPGMLLLTRRVPRHPAGATILAVAVNLLAYAVFAAALVGGPVVATAGPVHLVVRHTEHALLWANLLWLAVAAQATRSPRVPAGGERA